jgi:hypothetical protein
MAEFFSKLRTKLIANRIDSANLNLPVGDCGFEKRVTHVGVGAHIDVNFRNIAQ